MTFLASSASNESRGITFCGKLFHLEKKNRTSDHEKKAVLLWTTNELRRISSFEKIHAGSTKCKTIHWFFRLFYLARSNCLLKLIYFKHLHRLLVVCEVVPALVLFSPYFHVTCILVIVFVIIGLIFTVVIEIIITLGSLRFRDIARCRNKNVKWLSGRCLMDWGSTKTLPFKQPTVPKYVFSLKKNWENAKLQLENNHRISAVATDWLSTQLVQVTPETTGVRNASRETRKLTMRKAYFSTKPEVLPPLVMSGMMGCSMSVMDALSMIFTSYEPWLLELFLLSSCPYWLLISDIFFLVGCFGGTFSQASTKHPS